MIILIVNIVRVYYGGWAGHWSETLIVCPIIGILPLLPTSLPITWLLLNWLGTAAILVVYHHSTSHPVSVSILNKYAFFFIKT